MQIGKGRFGAVHEYLGPAFSYEGSQVQAQECVVKVARDSQDNICVKHEVEAYGRCKRHGLCGAQGYVPDLYGHGVLEDGRAYLVLQKLHPVPLEELDKSEVEQAQELLQEAFDWLVGGAGVIHGDIKWSNAAYIQQPVPTVCSLNTLSTSLWHACLTAAEHGTLVHAGHVDGLGKFTFDHWL